MIFSFTYSRRRQRGTTPNSKPFRMKVPSDANNLVNEGQPFTAQASDGQFGMVLGGHREISKAATTKEAPKTCKDGPSYPMQQERRKQAQQRAERSRE